MTTVRPADQPSQDPLRGQTEHEAERELLRLTARIEEITAHLARYHYGPDNMVGKNLLAELEGLEIAAHDLEQRLIEARAKGLIMWTPDYIYATRQRERRPS